MLDYRSKLTTAIPLGLVLVWTSTSCSSDPAIYEESAEVELCDPDVSDVSMRAIVEETSSEGLVASVELEYGDSPCENDSVWINGAPATGNNSGRFFSLHFDNAPEDGEFVFEYYRAGREEPVVARVTLPEDIDVTSPMSAADVPLNDGFEIAWTPPQPGTILIAFDPSDLEESQCLDAFAEVVEDSGLYQVPGGAITIDEEAWDLEECRLRIVLERTNDGDYPSEFAPGTIQASRYGSVTVNPLLP